MGKKLRQLKKWMVYRSEKSIILTRPRPMHELMEASSPAMQQLGLVLTRNITVIEYSAMMKNMFGDGGSFTARAVFNKDTFKPGEIASVRLNIDNRDGKKNIEKIVIKFR
jgi:hypothetical protein